MFNNKLAEDAAKAIAATKEIYSQKTAIGAYQSMVQSLTFAFPSDKEAIYEATGISARPVPTVPLIGRQMQSVPRRPMVNGKVVGKPCPTCGKTIKQVTKSNLKPAPRVQKVDKEIDDLLEGLNLTNPSGAESQEQINEITTVDELTEKQKVINELREIEKEDEEKPKANKGGRPRIKKDGE